MSGDNGIYPYKPNKAACIIAAALFGLSATYHLFQLVRSRAWFYTSFVVGASSKSQLGLDSVHTLISVSDDGRIHLPLHFCWIPCRFGAVHWAILIHHLASFALRRYDIHDIRPSRPFRQCYRSFDHPSNIGHQGVRLWRRGFFLHAGWRRRYDGAS